MFRKILSGIVSAGLLLGNVPALVSDVQQTTSPETTTSEVAETSSSEAESTDTTSQPDPTEETTVTEEQNETSNPTEAPEAATSESDLDENPPEATVDSDGSQEQAPIVLPAPAPDEEARIKAIEVSTDANQTVSSWEEFKAALNNKEVTNVVVAKDLTATSAGPTVARKVNVEFANHVLDIKGQHLTINAPGEVTIHNLSFTGTSAGEISHGNGTLIVEGAFKSLAGNEAGIADMVDGTVNVLEASVQYDREKRTTAGINAKFLNIVNSSIISNAIKFHYVPTGHNGAKVVVDGSTVEVNSNRNSDSGQVWQLESQSDFFIKNSSSVRMTGDISHTGETGGVFIIDSPKTTLNVSGNSTLDVYSKNSPALIIQSKGGAFNVDQGSLIKLQSDGEQNNLGATLRFRYDGDMTFNVTNKSKIEVIKTRKSNESRGAPGIRLYGGNNKINVSGGSDFIVRNEGNGTPKDPGGDGDNQGIQYTVGGNNEFNLTDENSSVLIDADNGAAIDAANNSMKITAAAGTYFTARGQTSGAKRGIFNAGDLTFNMQQVKYFDFRNDRSGGGYVLENNASSSFTSNKSDLSLWEAGKNLDGDPTYQWYQLDFSMTGTNFDKLQSTSNSEMQSKFGGMTKYSRMSANNQSAIIDEIRVPTNADKFVYAHATIPEAKDESRDAFTGEVLIKIGVFDATGKQVATVQGESIGDPLPVYGEAARKGLFKIDAPNKEFLKADYTLKVLEAWRGKNGSTWTHHSYPEEITTDNPKVYDVTPSDPVTVTGNRLTISPGTKELTGKGTAGDELHVYLNDTDTGIRTKVDAEGSFKVALPDNLQKDDQIQLLLKDHAGQAKVSNPPETNDHVGNIQPLTEMDYHNATFKEGTRLQVAGTIELLSVPTKLDFKQQKVSNKTETYHPAVTGKLQISDTRGTEKTPWQLYLKETVGLHSANNDLSGLLSYKNKNTVVNIGRDKQVVESGKLTADGVLDITNQWNGNYGISLTVPVGKQIIGDYQGTLSWSLESVPGNE